MGSAESKLGSPQTWKASGPQGVSQDLVDSLQSSPETDASRARTIELQVQARVAEELKKLQKRESDALKTAHDKLSRADDAAATADQKHTTTNSYAVGKEVEALRTKLESRKALRPLPDGVEGARSEVVRCLRENDRRPLDCWEEVEKFKAEVRKLETEWVGKASS